MSVSGGRQETILYSDDGDHVFVDADGNRWVLAVSDLQSTRLLSEIRNELRTMNVHLGKITDELVEPSELEGD